ncbi:MAG: HD domain-containing phosphohydrolase [Thermoanaerobaculales bacterium]
MGFTARFRSSLTYPIAATLVLVTVVPVALVGLLLANYNRDQLKIVEQRYLGRQAVSLAGEISLFLENHSTQLSSTARAMAANERIDVTSLEKLLQETAQEPGRSFVYLQILDTNGVGAYVRSPALDTAAVQRLDDAVRTAHESAMAGARVEKLLLDAQRARPAKALLAFPVRTRNGEVWGSLTGILDLAPWQARLTDNVYTGLLVSLIDPNGQVVLSSEAVLRGASLASSPLVHDFLARPVRLTRTYIQPIDLDAGQVLGSVAPVEVLGLGVVVERPTADAFAPVRVMQRRTLGLSALAALIALGIGLTFSRRLITPLQDLAATSSEIAEGNLTVRANVRGKDEIARLGSNFNHMAGSIEALVRRLKQALRQNQELFLETIQTLAAAIDAKDPYTRGHSERVSSYSMAIARHLGLNQEEVFRVRIAAILHDVGKLGVRDGILNKPGGLSEEEFAVMRQHPGIGAQIMAPIRMLRDIIPGIRNHHETWDGKGYPDRMVGDQIPMVARIIGIADTFDAMTTDRPYQDSMSLDFVVAKMQVMSGTRFDPAVVEAFMAAVESGDISPSPPKPSDPTPVEIS